MRAAIYIRVSTEMQAENGISLEAQKTSCERYCDYMNYEIVETITDAGISAKNTKRQGLQHALKLAQAGKIDCLIVYSLSRFARNTIDTLQLIEQLEACNVAFHSLTEKLDTSNAIGRFFLTTLAALAELERNQLSERTIAALKHKKEIGERTGTIPFGKKLASDGKQLIDNKAELQTIELIKTLRNNGFSYRQIALELMKSKVANRTGAAKWNESQIYKLYKKVG